MKSGISYRKLLKSTAYTTVFLSMVTLWACKPTEQNYRNAYDKAYEAARRKAVEMNTGTDGTQLESMDGSRIEQIGEESFSVYSTRVKPSEEGAAIPEDARLAVAVAKFSMPTNARSTVGNLSESFPEAFMAQDGEGNYYAVIATVAEAPEAVAPVAAFRKKYPDYPYLGLDGRPALVIVK